MTRMSIAGLILVAFSSLVQANSLKNCIAQVAEINLHAKTAFQTGMRDMIIQDAPEFEALAGINWELQTGLAKARHRQLQFLLSTDPERLVVDGNVSKLSNFDWSQADSAKLAGLDAKYKALRDRIVELRARNDGHVDWPKLRKFVADVLSKTTGYKDLVARLSKDSKSADSHFKTCRGG